MEVQNRLDIFAYIQKLYFGCNGSSSRKQGPSIMELESFLFNFQCRTYFQIKSRTERKSLISKIDRIFSRFFPYLGKKSLCSFEVGEVTVETNAHTCYYTCHLNKVNATEIYVDIRGLSKFSKPPMKVCELLVKEQT